MFARLSDFYGIASRKTLFSVKNSLSLLKSNYVDSQKIRLQTTGMYVLKTKSKSESAQVLKIKDRTFTELTKMINLQTKNIDCCSKNCTHIKLNS